VALRIAHLSFSRTGGAGGVASRLADIQRTIGHDSRVVSAITGSLRDAPLANPRHTLAAATDENIIRKPGFGSLISLRRDRLNSDVGAVIDSSDVIHIHWPNGFVDLEWLAEKSHGKKVVWTLHDMNAFTGACHYSLGCEGFRESCAQCPAVRAMAQESVPRHLSHKIQALEAFSNLQVVSPSHWLAQEASASRALGGYSIEVIPNPLPADLPPVQPRQQAREKLGLSGSERVVLALSASHLDDPVKAARVAIDAFKKAFPSRDATMFVMGRGPLEAHDGIRPLGFVPSEQSRTVMAASDYLVVPSRAENQPLVISEAQAMGASIIVRNGTGLPEHLDINPAGLSFKNDAELPTVLNQAATNAPNDATRATLAEKARDKFAPEAIARAYDAIYAS